ncbi:MAG TPA: hypothetical protein PLR88_13060 [Bacteroidales bacterium]|nr:hypothetical protein [Bacteroidales bacterium]
MTRRHLLYSFLIFPWIVASGQKASDIEYIVIKGRTLDESGVAVPQPGIYSFTLHRGAAGNDAGAFSVNSTPGDTLFFTSTGYKPTLLVVPFGLTTGSYTSDVIMVKDTIAIDDVIVLPFRSYSEFKNTATQPKVVSPETENMISNIALVRQQLYYHLEATPGEGYRFTIQQMAYNAYTKGQLH